MGYKLEHTSLEHNGGTKDYDVVLLVNDVTGRTLMIRRWGRVGADGQFKVMQFAHKLSAHRYTQKIVSDKTERGYEVQECELTISEQGIENLNYIATSTNITLEKAGVTAADLKHIGIDIYNGHFDNKLEVEVEHEYKQAACITPSAPQKPSRPDHYGSW